MFFHMDYTFIKCKGILGQLMSIIYINTRFVSHSKSFYVAYLFCANACPTGESVQPALWLQTLMDACCSAADSSIQAVAISLVMDLVGLTQSVAMVTAERVASPDTGQPMSPSQGRVAVVIRPPLTQGILKYIAEKTNFFKVCIISLLLCILL